MKFIPFNLNHYVRVKLTDYGRSIHREQYRDLEKMVKQQGGRMPPYSLQEDAEGYSKWQMWSFMSRFGSYFELGERPVVESTEVQIQIEE